MFKILAIVKFCKSTLIDGVSGQCLNFASVPGCGLSCKVVVQEKISVSYRLKSSLDEMRYIF